MNTVLSHANLIDCVEPKVRPDSAVLIEDGRIRAILPSGEAGSAGDAQVIDLKGGYLMPGLWDVHIHPDYLSLDEMPLADLADQVTLFGHRLTAALTESGIVGLRCAGAHHFMDVAWKRAFDSGQHLGPRLFASGYFLTTTGGHFLTSGHALEVDGPYGWVKAIREQIKNGVDHIKLNLSGGIMGPAWDLHTHSFLLDDEIRAAFEICRKRGFKVMAHATNPEAVKNAIRLGAHSVEHGYIMDDECIALLLEHDTWYVPTLAQPDRPLIPSKPTGLQSAGSRLRCVAVPRQPRMCTPRGSARRSMPVYEWHWALTSALSRTPRCSRWGYGFAMGRRRGRRW